MTQCGTEPVRTGACGRGADRAGGKAGPGLRAYSSANSTRRLQAGRLSTMDMHTAHDIWQTLVRASVDRRHPWRAVGLSTQGADGPQSRHVILRKAHPDARQLVFYTDARSGKMTELALCERVALLMWNPQQRQQLRLWGTARAESDPATIERHWAAVPDQARRDYASLQAPGAVLHTPSPDHGAPCDLQAARNHFTVLRVQIERLDLLVLNRDRHVRSGHRWEAGAGCWQTDERVP